MLIGRRKTLALAAGLAGSMALDGGRQAWADDGPNQFTLGCFGGIFDTALNTLRPALQTQTGLEMQKTAATSQIILAKLAASQGRPPFDAVMMTAEAMLLAAQRGMLRTVSAQDIPNIPLIQQRILAPFRADGGFHSVPVHWKIIGILWRRDLVPFEIRSWQDLWRPELRNRISVQNMPTLGGALMLIAAANAHGGSQKNLEPGWKAMQALRPNVRDFYAITSNAITSLVAGDTWVSVNTLDLGRPLAPRNVVATIPTEGVTYSPEGLGFPTGAANTPDALKFANFMLDPQQQVAWAGLAKVAPSTRVVVPADVQKDLIETDAVLAKLFDIDFLDIGMNMQKWSERWRQDVVG
jgi:putative spermidine/putrescine transport system substrate-binding protein